MLSIKNVTLNLANKDDFDFFYRMQKESENMYWSGFALPPKIDDLLIWFCSIIEKQSILENRKIYIIKINYDSQLKKCGYMYLDYVNSNECVVSIAISDKLTNCGIGTKAIDAFCLIASQMGFKKVKAEIREDNSRSQKVFSKNSFVYANEHRKAKL